MKIKKLLAYILSGAMVLGLMPGIEIPVSAADKIDAAIYATPTSDFTASWENLNGINNPDFEPTASNMQQNGLGWGDWDWNNTAGSEHNLTYTWDTAITTDTFQIYWYDDGGGTRVPATISFDYLDTDGSTWKSLEMVSDYNSITAIDKYNNVSVKSVTTKGIRMNMTIREGAGGTGVYRWKVMAEADSTLTAKVLQYASDQLNIGPRISANVQLPDTLPNGVSITWTEDHSALQISGGQLVVTRGEEDVTGKVTANISFNGKTVSKEFTITVPKKMPEIEGMLAKYDFSGLTGSISSGSYISDISGHGNDAVVRGNNITASDNVLTLPGGESGSSEGYVELPQGMFDNQNQLTIAMWIKNDMGAAWTSAFFFGKDTTSYFMINPQNPTSGAAKMCITWNGSGEETGLAPGSNLADGPFTGSDWTHYTAVITENSITGYINGEKYNTYPLSHKISDMGSGLSSFIGRSFYGDPYFKGSVKGVSIYNQSMDDAQVGALYTEGLTDDEILSNASAALSIPEVTDNVLVTSQYDRITLKSSVLGGLVKISWKSDNTSIIGSDGTVKAPQTSENVKLTATLSVNDKTLDKDFNIIALSKDDTAYEMTVDMKNKGVDISQELFGLFYEDINSAADGGLSPEMVKNNSFENYYDVATPDELPHGNQSTWKWSWTSSASSRFVVEQTDGLNAKNTNYAKITGNMTLTNNGFAQIYETGAAAMPIVQGNDFDFSMFVKADASYKGTVKVKAVNESGAAITDEKEVSLIKDGTWQKVYATLSGKATEKGKLVLTFANAASSDVIYIDMVSLIPQDSYGYGNKNYAYGAGIRKDLVERLQALKPSFIRFPGGCVIEGDSGKHSFYNWENSVGPLEERKATANYWGKQEYFYQDLDSLQYGYMMSYEFGYHEILTLCEDMGAEPFPILSAGIHCQFKNSAPAATGSELDEFAKYATDLLDYCWGDPDSSDEVQAYWAKKRVENGHKEPFELHYMGIGNENWNDEERGINYFENFEYIKKIVDAYGKKNYPERYEDFTLISSTGPYAEGSMMYDAWNWLDSTMPGETLADEHYYMGLSWMLDNTHRYDSYKRLNNGGSNVFVGEYAVNSSINTLEAAIGEAAYMTGLERNADIVRHASYAPLLQKVGAKNWEPNLIYFDEYNTMGTPNYYVQYMYSNNYGKSIVNTTLNKIGTGGSYNALEDTQKDIYQVSSMDEQYIYLKLVNHDSYDKGITLKYPGVANGSPVEFICLTGDKDAVNEVGNETVKPVTSSASIQNEQVKYVIPAMSFTVVKVKYTDPVYGTLTGNVTISGEAKSGETVAAVITGSNNTGKYSYQWKADGNVIAGAVSKTYTIPESMSGKKISVVITSSKETGELSAEMESKVDESDVTEPDKSGLSLAVNEASALKQSDYTPESWQEFAQALSKAKAVLESDSVSETEIDSALAELKKAQNNLVKTPEPTDSPEPTKAPVPTDSPEPTKEPEQTEQPVQTEAPDKTPDNKPDNKPADKGGLQAAITQASALKQSDYTPDSWNVYIQAFNNANTVFNNANATEEEVAAAYAALAEAIRNLVPAGIISNPSDTVKEGALVTISDVEYSIVNAERGEAEVSSVNQSDIKNLKIADTVTINGATLKVTSIKAKAFAGMKKLRKITIGKNIVSIGKKAFFKDKNLKKIVIKSKKLKKVKANAFKNINAKAVIKVPKKLKKKYTRLLKNKGQAKSVKIK